MAVVSGLAASGVACSDSEPNVVGFTDGGGLPPPTNAPFDAAPSDTDSGVTPDDSGANGTDSSTAPDSAAPVDAPVG